MPKDKKQAYQNEPYCIWEVVLDSKTGQELSIKFFIKIGHHYTM